jgi:hypothetical protein
MIIREEVDIHRVDDFHIPWRVLLPIAVSLAVRRAAAEVIDVRVKLEMESHVRPAQAAPAQVQNDRGRDMRSLSDVKHDRNFIRRDRAFANDNHFAFGNLVIVPDGKVKAPEAIT